MLSKKAHKRQLWSCPTEYCKHIIYWCVDLNLGISECYYSLVYVRMAFSNVLNLAEHEFCQKR